MARMAKQKEKRGYVIGLQRPRWVSLFFFRFVSFERAFLRTPRLQRIKRKPCKHFRNAPLFARNSKAFYRRRAPFLGKRNFSIWNFPVNRCMCCVSLKWWLWKGGGGRVLNWKELEMRFILKNVYLYVYNVVL